MATAGDRFTPDLTPPKLRYSVMELGRVILEIGATSLCGPLLKKLPEGDGHTIITIPGFMGADGSTAMLRRFLNEQGYNAIPWRLGRNASEVKSDKLEDFIEHRAQTEGQIAPQGDADWLESGWSVCSSAGPPLSTVDSPGYYFGYSLRGSKGHGLVRCDGPPQ
jgi:hypothetical protein